MILLLVFLFGKLRTLAKNISFWVGQLPARREPGKGTDSLPRD